ncbi:hypothetical protein P0W64_00705 [Tsukamurella sp. 8F]|uniref:hypothetical protein n=1 Tax=unclassified Tsukamurella TaxID=2633480 RepID=UPI0023B91F09|nr:MULTISPECIES: hypothetical protein [unclassified Tsukamurella]MDF0531401.1 hypothetical protein [Tsukamurella sp. 8J]MDF0585293.1 hypothetical protein [Tsukamurella sp. 8F]
MSHPAPYQPPEPPGGGRTRPGLTAKLGGWALIVLGALVALSGLVGGTGFAGRLAGLLLGVVLVLLGAILVWRVARWKVGGPIAAVLAVVGVILMPSSTKPEPVNSLVGPTSTTTTVITSTVTVSATETVSTISAAPTTTTTPATTTEATGPTGVAGIRDTATRTPVPAPRTTTDAPRLYVAPTTGTPYVPPTTYTQPYTPPAPAYGGGGSGGSGIGAGSGSSGRSGAICRDGTTSSATGRGACSHHGGVAAWT